MSRRTLLERYNKQLDEEIHPHEADSDEKSLITLIKGKRDVAYLTVSKRFRRILEKYKLGIIPIRMMGMDSMKAIVYRNKEKAIRLHKIAMSHKGYLSDKTSEEAREIGNLLGYFKEDIEKYIKEKYGFRVPIINEPSPDDFDDLSEQRKKKISALNEDIRFKRTTELFKKLSTYLVFHWFFL